MTKLIKILILTFIFSFSIPIVGNYINSSNSLYALTSGDHHKKKHKTKKDGRRKSVHVRSYTTKKGKHVHSYNRRPPKRHKH